MFICFLYMYRAESMDAHMCMHASICECTGRLHVDVMLSSADPNPGWSASIPPHVNWRCRRCTHVPANEALSHVKDNTKIDAMVYHQQVGNQLPASTGLK